MNLPYWRLRVLLRPAILLGVTAAGLVWLTGYFYAEVLLWRSASGVYYSIGTSGRSLVVWRTNPGANVTARWGTSVPEARRWKQGEWLKAGTLGRGVRWITPWSPRLQRFSYGWMWVLPWSNVALAAVLTILMVRLLHAPGRCRRCGYDLTGLTSNKCPECGGAISPPPMRPALSAAPEPSSSTSTRADHDR